MKKTYEVELRSNVKTPMRDGVELSSDLYLPKASGKFPTVLHRTPYGNNTDAEVEKARMFANQGYVYVTQDTRGRWDSDGNHYPFHHDGPDGFDTQEWIGGQEWSNGKIGMTGSSYGGLVQLLSAPYRSQYLTCIAPRVICADFFGGLVYPGGALMLNVAMTWGMRTNGRTAQNISYHNWTEAFRGLPIRELDEVVGRNLPFWKDWIDHSQYDEYWNEIDVEDKWGEFAVPALNMGGWFDLYANDTFTNFTGQLSEGGSKETRQSRIIVGPWPHNLSQSRKTGEIDFGAQSLVDLEGLELRWFDYWLKGIDNGIMDEPPVRLFIMGINEWRDENEWPLARTDWQEWYLHSDGRANSVRGDGTLSKEPPGEEKADHFIYDPNYPVQTVGGNNCCTPDIVPWGPYDQRAVEMRGDVLCFTSSPFEQDTEITGPIKLILYAETDGPDTDWTAKVVDVSTSGYAMNLCDGILRARFRESRTDPKPLIANQVYEYEIEVGVTGNVFRKGHSLRLEVSSSNFPRFDRNLNTGNIYGKDTEMRTARQVVHHNREYPSRLILPLIPAS